MFSQFGSGDVWAITGLSFSNPVDDVLDRNNFTLEDLLIEDELIQEVKSKNNRLIELLTMDATLKQCLSYITKPSRDRSDDNITFKYPYVCTEIIRCDIPAILDALLSEEHQIENLELLLAFLDEPAPLDTYLAGYFESVLEILFQSKTLVMIQYINNNSQTIFQKFLKHIYNYSIMQLVQRLLLAHIPLYGTALVDSVSDFERRMYECNWAYEFDTCTGLVDVMLNSEDYNSVIHVYDLLITVLQLSPADAPMLKHLCDPSIVTKLWAKINQMHVETVDEHVHEISIIAVLECLVSRLHESASSIVFNPNQNAQSDELLSVLQIALSNVMCGVCDTLPVFAVVLSAALANQTTNHINQLKQQFRPAGHLIVTIVKLIESLVRLGDETIDSCLCKSNILSLIFDMFFSFPFNSLLHLSIQRMFLFIFDNYFHRRLICRYIFESCNITNRIIEALNDVVNVQIASRPPVAGHLIIIAQTINTILKHQSSTDSADFNPQDDETGSRFLDVVKDHFDIAVWGNFAETSLETLTSYESSRQVELEVVSINASPQQLQDETFQVEFSHDFEANFENHFSHSQPQTSPTHEDDHFANFDWTPNFETAQDVYSPESTSPLSSTQISFDDWSISNNLPGDSVNTASPVSSPAIDPFAESSSNIDSLLL